MKPINRLRAAQLPLCILFVMTGGNAIVGILDCAGDGTTATGISAVACGVGNDASNS